MAQRGRVRRLPRIFPSRRSCVLTCCNCSPRCPTAVAIRAGSPGRGGARAVRRCGGGGDVLGLELGSWHAKIPGLRVIVRDELLHPPVPQADHRAGEQLGRRYQLIATNTRVGQVAWLDARHRPHVHVENDVKQARRWAWTSGPPATGRSTWRGPRSSPWPRTCSPASATSPYPRVSSATPPRNCYATGCCTCLPARPAPRATQTVAPPARRLALGRRPDQHLARGHCACRANLTTPRCPDDHGRTIARSVESGATDATV